MRKQSVPIASHFLISGVPLALKRDADTYMVERLEPLSSGRDTEIDMIEREMEGGVLVIQPAEVHEHTTETRLGGLVNVEEHVEVFEIGSKPPADAKD